LVEPAYTSEGPSEVELAQRGLTDLVFFAHYFMPESFPDRMPWLHRALFAILTEQTDFLWSYGEVHKIMREFVERDTDNEDPETNVTRRLFRAFGRDGRELLYEEVLALETGVVYNNCDLPTPSGAPSFVEELGLVLYLDIGRYTEIVIPRGFSKTTIAGQAVPLYKILYRLLHFMVYISESGTHAEMQANNIRTLLRGNQQVQEVFGDLSPARSADEKWSERFFETTSGFALAARGRGSQIRGLLHRNQRPQLEIWDDLEDQESVETEAQRKKTRKWAYGNAMPALPELDPNSTIVALGTLLHANCLLMTLANDPDWTTIIFGVQDSTGEWLWPEMWDEKKDKVKRRSYDLAGELSTYYLEYRSQLHNEESSVFLRKFFIYSKPDLDDIEATAIYCDPALSEREGADWAVIQVASISKTGIIYLRDEARKRSIPDLVNWIVEEYFRLAILYTPEKHGFESTAFQAALATVFREHMFRQHYFFEPIKVPNVSRKVTRIRAIVAPRHRSGTLHFCKRFPETEGELIDFDPTKKEQQDDGPDCLAGVIPLLDPFAGVAASVDEEDEELEISFEEEVGLAVGEDWRGC
jgi:hypothetical protein